MEDLGGGRAHNARSGVAHYLGDDEEDAFSYVKELLSFLPSNNLSDPPVFPAEPADEPVPELDTIIPDSPNTPYDIHGVIEQVLDGGEFLEVHALFAPNIVVGFGRSTAGRSAWWPTSRPSSRAASTSTPRRRPPGSCARATRSTCRC